MRAPDAILHEGRRSAPQNGPLSTRTAIVRAPASLDEGARSIRVVMSTEQPVMTFDWERYEYVPEVLLAAGMQAPSSGQVPFLDSHSRHSVENVLGSARDFKPVEAGGYQGVDAEVTFSSTSEGESALRKYMEGHLTDVSVGYGVASRVFVEANTTATVNGRTYTGPISVVTEWRLKELSAAPIGADDLAKARSQYQRQGGDTMNKKLRKLLEARGLAPAASDAQAQAFLDMLGEDVRKELVAQSERADGPATDPAPAPQAQPPADPARAPAPQAQPPADPARAYVPQAQGQPIPVDSDLRAEGARAERERIAVIDESCRKAGLPPEFARKLVDSGQPLDKCRELILDEMGARSQVLGGHVELGQTDGEKFRSAAADSLALRSGVRLEKPADGAADLRGRSLSQLAEECLDRSGVPTRRLSRVDIAMRAFTSSSDFPLILGSSVNRVLRASFDVAPSTYEAWTRITDAPDFKAMDRLQLSEAPDMLPVGESGEYKHGGFIEGKESYKVGKFGRRFAVTYEAIVNDDLGALTRIPTLFGNAARRKPNELVYSILSGNPNMGDGKALFHADHKNLAGSGAAISVDTLSAGRKAMRKQRDIAGVQRLNLSPRYLLVPSDLETATDVLLRSLSDPSATNPNTVNPFQNRLTPIVDACLDVDSGAIPYFLACDPGQMDTIEVAFLQGMREPTVESRTAFEVDGMEFKIRIVFGAKAIDWRGLYKNPGVSA